MLLIFELLLVIFSCFYTQNKPGKAKWVIAGATIAGSWLVGAYNIGNRYSDNGFVFIEYPNINFKHKEIFGVYDYCSVRRGFQVFREVCSTCHNCQSLAFRSLDGTTHTHQEVRNIASQVGFPVIAVPRPRWTRRQE